MSPALNANHYRDKLHAVRARLDGHVSQFADDVHDLSDSADRASQQTEVVVNIGLATHEAELRKEIDDALDRIDAGTFAICENCRAVIAAHRLNAIPHARYCIRCERRVEQGATI